MDTNTENFTPACGVTTITHLQHLLALGVLLFEDGISSPCGWTVHFTSFVKQISSFRVNFGVTVQTEQGHDSDWRDFSTTYCEKGRKLGSMANTRRSVEHCIPHADGAQLHLTGLSYRVQNDKVLPVTYMLAKYGRGSIKINSVQSGEYTHLCRSVHTSSYFLPVLRCLL